MPMWLKPLQLPGSRVETLQLMVAADDGDRATYVAPVDRDGVGRPVYGDFTVLDQDLAPVFADALGVGLGAAALPRKYFDGLQEVVIEGLGELINQAAVEWAGEPWLVLEVADESELICVILDGDGRQQLVDVVELCREHLPVAGGLAQGVAVTNAGEPVEGLQAFAIALFDVEGGERTLVCPLARTDDGRYELREPMRSELLPGVLDSLVRDCFELSRDVVNANEPADTERWSLLLAAAQEGFER